MFTIFGGNGFIGRHLAAHLRREGQLVAIPAREETPEAGRHLGHVFYCIGLTADFRGRPLDTVEAHVCRLAALLRTIRFDSFLYFSSTRVYGGADSAREDSRLAVDVETEDGLYNLTKLAGESLCLNCGSDRTRVVRLSNVVGAGDSSPNFITAVARDAVAGGNVRIDTALDSAKDYVLIEDVVPILPWIAMFGRHRLYNLAGGRNLTHREVLDTLAAITGCRFEVAQGAPAVRIPAIVIDRLRDEFGYAPRSAMDGLGPLVRGLKDRATR